MLITANNEGIYEASITMLNKEVANYNPVDIAKMGIALTRIDIMATEISTVREEIFDLNDIYKILEGNNVGNPMRNGANWRARVMTVMKEILGSILQSSNITETYMKHYKVIHNFISENTWTENQEMITIGWVETNRTNTIVKCQMTKRCGHDFNLRMKIFETKKRITRKCKENNDIGM